MFKSILSHIRNWFRAEADRMRKVRAEIARDQLAMQREQAVRELKALMHRASAVPAVS
jgi:hypothetical protein